MYSNCNVGHVKANYSTKKQSKKNYQYKVLYNLYEIEGFSKNYYCRNVQSSIRKINKTINHNAFANLDSDLMLKKMKFYVREIIWY